MARVVVITGGGTGIGAACARLMRACARLMRAAATG
ncbi:3-oxoacyl-ACP reductase, partial [Klebsiella pneumoniae]